jgi:oxygen-independent coproporphyrinogen-3 oxidase
VPFWNTATLDATIWENELQSQIQTDSSAPISIYAHLPFCESLCHFCGCNKKITRNHAEENPYLERLLREWALYAALWPQAPLITEMHLGGGTPTFFSAENLQRLTAEILSKGRLTPGVSLSFEAHPNSTDALKLQALHEVGFRRLSLGIQDYNPEVQKVINRIQTEAGIKAVVETARRIGYNSINFDLIYGLPLQTSERLKRTIQKTLELMPDRIAFYSYAHVPWVSKAQRLYSEADLPAPDQKLQLYLIGKDMLLKAGYVEIGMDHFALPHDSLCRAAENGSLHRNFMGYTDNGSKVMLGLGVSSISDANGVFAQNFKSLMEYERAVDSGKLPVFRGHLPDSSDQKYRKIILDLMCRFSAHINQDISGAERLQKIKSQTRLLEADGLCFWEDNNLVVTPLGRQFVRNVCMAVDPYLEAEGVREQLFSKTI